MIPRLIADKVEQALNRQAAVALIGPRQVGKTTLALDIGKAKNALYLDLEDRDDRNRLANPRLFFENVEDRLVILDEIHRMPDLFETLRGVIDKGRQKQKGKGRFLILGSASIDLMRQSSETLAGRIAYIDMSPLWAYSEDGGGQMFYPIDMREEGIKPAIDPSHPKQKEMIKAFLAPSHANAFESLLDQPLASAFYHATSEWILECLKILIPYVFAMALKIILNLGKSVDLRVLQSIAIEQLSQLTDNPSLFTMAQLMSPAAKPLFGDGGATIKQSSGGPP